MEVDVEEEVVVEVEVEKEVEVEVEAHLSSPSHSRKYLRFLGSKRSGSSRPQVARSEVSAFTWGERSGER